MSTYLEFKQLLTKITDLNNVRSVLSWDQETQMPPKGGRFRAQQIATLAGMAHEQATSETLGKLIEQLQQDTSLDNIQQKNVALAARDYNRSKKYTREFVVELSQLISQSNQAWQKAKKEDNFSLFAPGLKKLVELKRKECDFLGYEEHPYDALIDQFEPGTTTAEVVALFNDVRSELVDFVKAINESAQPDDSFLSKHYDKDKQWELGLDLLKQMGYDFDAGRQDISSHPFTTNFSPEDVRVTTRINETQLDEMIWSCIHEGGHALYEQGLPVDRYGEPVCEYISLGMHESQSRLWENNVARGLPYWKANYAKLQSMFPDQLGSIDLESFHKGINRVKPSLIRTSADELTYHFHVLIRFEIEKGLIEGNIQVEDLPEIWNARYKEYLGVEVPDNRQGVLQDVHWSHGSFGYFPTYSIGSFYAAQFYQQAVKDVPGLENSIENGDLLPMLGWLRENIHRHGKLYSAREMCKKVTGEPLNFSHFKEYAWKKFGAIYGLSPELTA